jgi:hypothetical protein
MNNTRQSLAPAKILSYATKEIDSEIEVTGLVAGDQMRGSAVQKYLSHREIRNLELTRIVGERRNDPFVQKFLSLPAADDSAFAQAGQPGHGVRVDLRASAAAPARVGRPPSRQPLPSAQFGGGCGGGTGLPPPADGAAGAGQQPWPQPSAPAVPAWQADSRAAATGHELEGNGPEQQPVRQATQRQPDGMPELVAVEQTANQTVIVGPGDEILQSGEQHLPGHGTVPFRRRICQRISQTVSHPDGQPPGPSPGQGGPAGGNPPSSSPPSQAAAGGQPPPASSSSPPSAAGEQPPGQGGPAGGTPPSPAPPSPPPSQAEAGGQPPPAPSSSPPSAAGGTGTGSYKRYLYHETAATLMQPQLACWPGITQSSIRLPFTVINQTAVQTVCCCQASQRANISQIIQGGSHWSQLSGTRPSTPENVSGCHPWPCVVTMPVLKKRKLRVRQLLCDQERLQARVAELEASHAKIETDRDRFMRENNGIKSQLSLQTQQVSDATKTATDLRKRAESLRPLVQHRAEARLDVAKKAADAMRKTATRALQTRDKRVSVSADGTRRPVHRVQAASRADGGKRMALEEVSTTTKGSFTTRTMGGLQYRRAECVFAMQSDVDEGIGSRSSRNKREEANMYRRAAADGAFIEVVPAPRLGHTIRRKPPDGPVQAFSRPSLTTMERVIRPLFRNLLYREARERLSRANTVVLTTDGKMFGGRHACGVLLCMYFMEPGDRIDPFGNGPETRSVLPVPLQLQMVCNKLVRDMWDRHGKKWALQTPFHVIRALRLAGLEEVAKKYGHMLCATTDAARDNSGLGQTKIAMDNMSGKNSLLEAVMVSECEWSEADEDLRRRGLLDILIVFHHGSEAQLRRLTMNLYALRKARRTLSELRRKARNIKAAQESASTNAILRQSQAHAAVSADAVGASSPSPISASGGTLPDACCSLGKTGSPIDGLITAAEQAVEAAGAKLAADAAAAAVQIAASQPTLAACGSPAPLPPSAPKEPEPIRLQLSGPLMQVPETVRRIFHLYEEKLVRPLLERQTLLRWWMRRWLWDSHLKRRVRLRIEIEVLEILTEIEFLKLEMQIDVLENLIEILILKPKVQSWGLHQGPIQGFEAGSLRDLGQGLTNLAETLRILRARKVNLRICTFRIQSLAAWAQDLAAEKKKKTTKNVKANETNKRRDKLSKAHAVRQLKLQRRCSQATGNTFLEDDLEHCPAFDLLSTDVWRFIFKFVDLRIRILLPAAAKVSMQESPSRFLPLVEQRRDKNTGEVHYHGHAQQCQNHAANNILDPCVRFLDHEILMKIIQGARCLKNIFIEDELMAAIDHLLSNQPACRDIDKHTDFFKRVREAVALQAVAGRGMSLEEVKQQMGYTEERGAQKTDTCAIVRWSTTTKAADWQATWRIGYAFGLLRIGGIAFDQQTEVDAAVSLFSYDGFRSDMFADLMLERKVAETFEILTGSRTLLQLFLLKFLHRFLFKPLMLVMGDNLECGDLMVGMGSIPRRMLRVLLRVLFVGGTWSRKLAHGHRTNGAEYTLSKWSLRFLNPLCGDRVRQMLGDGWDDPMHASILEGMVNAPSELIAAFRTLALKKDPLMPQEAELVFMKSHPDLFRDPNKDSRYCLRMIQMQVLAQQVIQDTAEQLEYCVRQNLQGVRAFIAGMMQTRWTFGSVSCKPDGQNLVRSAINYAHEMALADAVITLKLGDEMMHEAKMAIEALARKNPAMQDKDPFAFWPAYVADAFGVEGKKDTQRFLGISNEQKRDGGWGEHYNHLDLLNCVNSAEKILSRNVLRRDGCGRVQVQEESPALPDIYLYPFEWIQKLYWGFHPWWLRKTTGMHQSYIFRWNRVSELPKPLQEFPAAYKPSVRASNFSVSAKRLEQHWAYPALMYATRSQMNNESLTHFYTVPAFRHMTPEELMEKAEGYKIAASQEFAQFAQLKQTFEVDKERRSVMKEDAHRALGEKARKSGVWSNTRHGGEYRRPGHAVLDPNTKQGRKTLKKVNKLSLVVCVRRGKIICAQQKSAGVQKRAPRQSAGAQKQPRKRPLAKQVSLSFKERAAAAAKRAFQRRSVAAGGGRRAPRSGPAAGGCGIRRQQKKVARLVTRASDNDDGDPDFVLAKGSGVSGQAGLEMETTRRSARGGGKGTFGGGDDNGRISEASDDDDGEAGSCVAEGEGNVDSDLESDMPLKPNGVKRPVEALAIDAVPVDGGKTASRGGLSGDTASGEGAGRQWGRRGSSGGGGGKRANGDKKDDGEGRGGVRRSLQVAGGAGRAGGAGANGGGGGDNDEESDGSERRLRSRGEGAGDGGAGGSGGGTSDDHRRSDDDPDRDCDSDVPLAERPGRRKAARRGGSGGGGEEAGGAARRQRPARGGGEELEGGGDGDSDAPLIPAKLNLRNAVRRGGGEGADGAARKQRPGGDDRVGGGCVGGSRRRRVEPHASTPPDSDDDTMYLPNLKLNKMQEKVILPRNIWSFDFAANCGHLSYWAYNRGSNKPQRQVWLMKETDTAVFSGVGKRLEATITRRASPYLRKLLDLKQFASASRDVKITFTARCFSGRNYYLKYDDFAGVVIVTVEEIKRPQEDATGNVDEDEKWKETFVYRRVFDTRDAALKAKGRPTHGLYMGEQYFRKLLKEEKENNTETFHEGDSTYKGDIRTLVGVVRWQQAGQSDLPKDYFTEYTEADLFHRGESVHQNPRQ